MDNKKQALDVTMKDINLLPDEIKDTSFISPKARRFSKSGDEVEGGKNLVNTIASKVSSVQYSKSKDIISSLSKNIKNSIVDSFQEKSEQAADFLHSLKKDKVRNLERLLELEKKDLVVSSKKNYIYSNSAGKMVIIDRDIWGEPCSVTIKETNKVIVKVVKFLDDIPYIFPVFNEKNVSGKIIHIDKKEIWYRNKDEATIVLFRSHEPDFIKVNLRNTPGLSGEALMDFMENSKILYFDRSLKELIIERRNVSIENIVIIRPNYTIYKNSQDSYTVLIFDEVKILCDELTLSKLPDMKVEGLDALFSKDIVEYIKTKGYVYENFIQDDNYIEYCEEVGSKRICVMRCKIG